MSSTVVGFEDAMGLFKEIDDSEVRNALNEIGDKAVNLMKGAVAEIQEQQEKALKNQFVNQIKE